MAETHRGAARAALDPPLAQPAPQIHLVDDAVSPEERAEIVRVYRALDRIPRDERLAWVLKFVEGETLESIADLLGCSVSTAQRRLRSAESKMDVNAGEVR